jgi:hypothetical protein
VSEHATNGVPYWGRELSRRIDHLERLEPAVVANEVKNLGLEMRSLRRAFYTFCVGVVGSAVVFAFTVFSLLGHR